MKIFPSRTELCLVPLRDMVIFPHMVVPFFVGRKKSIRAVQEAMGKGKLLFLATQKHNNEEEPGEEDIYPIGTVARILQMLKLPDGTIRLLVEGNERANIVRYLESQAYFKVQVRTIQESPNIAADVSALTRTVINEFNRYNALYKKIPKEILAGIEKVDSPHKLVNMICSNIPIKVEKKIELLSQVDIRQRLENLATTLAMETQVLEIEQKITSKVRKKIQKTQKEYFLQEQLKEIHKELGTDKDDPTGAKDLETKLKSKNLPEDVFQKCEKELKRLARMQPISPESAVLRTYLEWIVDLPWSESTKEIRDIEYARRILDEDHYDLKKVKERVLDFIAVRLLNRDQAKGPILCFVGPPGTGKTSLGKSVARALGRDFVRISLGGVRDEAEIRGHRKTYVGALPGKILQSMRKAGSRNPVFLLDEVDKMSSDFRGDPASALLEVLDPEQNSTFMDHYLEVQYDLSHVMFITTANSVHNIPYPLRDRMEIIHIPGYSEFEKLKIAQAFLIPKQIEENGLGWAKITFQEAAILKIIRSYTMESGVRSLEREIATVLRKIARQAVKKGLPAEQEAAEEAASTEEARPEEGSVQEAPADEAQSEKATEEESRKEASRRKSHFSITVTPKRISEYLGNESYQEKMLDPTEKAGLVYGLAWTELGGRLLPVEVALLEGKGELILTGSLGEVMKESAQTALSYLRAHAEDLKIPPDFSKDRDIHIHVPEGSIPKDGPSAGITITAGLLSALRNKAVRKGYAMTGEITLTGRLLPIGGIKEKVLAAHRNRMTDVLMPEMNSKDIEELPKEVRSTMKFHLAETILDALLILFPKTAKSR
ncbi:MAG: endopeptidase La [Spirochaetaceae bacterium]|nr:MAG: endopeptidase La [Spirochaetaceae bacterium]